MIDGTMCDNISLKCAHNLSDIVRTSFKTVLNEVADLSPSDSMVDGELDLKDGQYHANVVIHSSELNVCTSESNGNVFALLNSLKHDLMEQIDAWKRIRTVEPHSA